MPLNCTFGRSAHITVLTLCLLITSGCGKKDSAPEGKIEVPRRIVSLSPSITKMIIELEKEDSLAGVTSYHPPLKKPVTVIGTLVNPVVEKILQVKPDAVLLCLEDGATQKTDQIRATGLRVVELERNRNFRDIKKNYLQLGRILGREKLAGQHIARYEKRLSAPGRKNSRALRVVFLVSIRPVITVSDGSFISAALRDAGGANVFKNLISAYPVISFEALIEANPDVIIVMRKGGKREIAARLKSFPLGVNKTGNIFEILPDRVAYYTPADYTRAVEEIRRYLAAADRKIRQK